MLFYVLVCLGARLVAPRPCDVRTPHGHPRLPHRLGPRPDPAPARPRTHQPRLSPDPAAAPGPGGAFGQGKEALRALAAVAAQGTGGQPAAPGRAEPPSQMPAPRAARDPVSLLAEAVGSPATACHGQAGTGTGALSRDCSHRCSTGSAGVIFLTFPRESCFLFRNPVANSLLWSSHLRWSDKYLPPVPGVLYFSHLTEQASPRRDL